MSSTNRAASLVLMAGFITLGLMAAADSPSAGAGETRTGLAIKRLKIDQRAWTLEIALRTRAPVGANQLSPQPGAFGRPGRRHACLRLVQRGKRWLACFGPAKRGGLRLVAARISKRGVQRGPRWTASRNVEQPNARAVRARVRFRALELRPGAYRVRAVSAWSGSECQRRAERQEPGSAVCRSAKPRRGLRRLRLRQPVPIGCAASGPSVVRSGSRSKRRVALTFDDGPGPYTSRILDVLDRHDARATFFVVGSEISGRTALLRRMLRDGHVVANHTWNHEIGAPASSLAATSRSVRAASGFTPCNFRPPGGVLSSRLVGDARRLGMTTVMWDVDPQDWRTPGSAAIRGRVLAATRPGSIVLLHDGGGNRSQTAAALGGIISTLKGRGYRLVTVPRLLRQRIRWRP